MNPKKIKARENAWSRVLRNEDHSFKELYELSWKDLYAFSYRFIQDEEACKDIVQQVFINLWTLEDKEGIKNISSYLFQSVRFKLLTYLRDNKTRAFHLDHFAKEKSHEFTPGTILEAEELREKIHAFIDALPEKRKEIFKLSRIQQLSNQEISGQLGISRQTVKNQITSALTFLRQQMQYLNH